MARGARGQGSGSQQKREKEIPGDRGEDGEAHQGEKGDGGGSEEAVRAEGRSTELGDPGATVAAFLGARQTQKRERGSREGRRRLGADLKRPGARGGTLPRRGVGRLRHAAWPGGSEERGVKTAPTSGPGRSASGRGGVGGCPARLAGLARLLGRAAGARGWAGGWRAERGRGRGE